MTENSDFDRAQADGRTSPARRFASRAAFVFFDKPLRFSLPMILILAFGGYTAATAPAEYRSVGVLSVTSETFLDTLSGTNSGNRNFNTPADSAARQFNELMNIAPFVSSVAEGAGLTDGSLTLAEVRAGVYAVPVGDALVNIVGIAERPDWAMQLASSGIATMKSYIISSEVQGTDVAEGFYDEQLALYRSEVDSASDQLRTFLAANPEPIGPTAERDLVEQLELQRLNDLLVRAQERFDVVFDNREAARLATLQTSADINERFRTLEEPVAPLLPESGLMGRASTLMLFGTLGFLLSAGAVAVVAVLDRSVYSGDDLEQLGAPLGAVVPHVKHFAVADNSPIVPQPTSLERPIRSIG